MDTSTAISIAAVIIAFLALPFSYWVAVRQVEVGLDEFERRSKQRARALVADALDEFFKTFYAVVRQLAGIDPTELQGRLKELDPRMEEIDRFVRNTGVLERLATAIDNLAATEFADLPQSSDLVGKLQSIRSQVALGSDVSRYATLGVISACGGADLQAELRSA